MSHQNEKHGMLEGIVSPEGLCQLFSRRQFLKLSGVSVIGISVLNPMLAGSETKAPLIIMEQARESSSLTRRSVWDAVGANWPVQSSMMARQNHRWQG